MKIRYFCPFAGTYFVNEEHDIIPEWAERPTNEHLWN